MTLGLALTLVLSWSALTADDIFIFLKILYIYF